jgi:transposase
MPQSPEVRKKAPARSFSDADKDRILRAYESAVAPVERAALLRGEAIYASHIANWRKARDGKQTPGSRRGRPSLDASELIRLRKENERLKRRLDKADKTIEVLGKVHALLQMAAGESAMDEQSLKKS